MALSGCEITAANSATLILVIKGDNGICRRRNGLIFVESVTHGLSHVTQALGARVPSSQQKIATEYDPQTQNYIF